MLAPDKAALIGAECAHKQLQQRTASPDQSVDQSSAVMALFLTPTALYRSTLSCLARPHQWCSCTASSSSSSSASTSTVRLAHPLVYYSPYLFAPVSLMDHRGKSCKQASIWCCHCHSRSVNRDLLEDTFMIYAFINSHLQIDMLMAFVWMPVGQFSRRRYHLLTLSLHCLVLYLHFTPKNL